MGFSAYGGLASAAREARHLREQPVLHTSSTPDGVLDFDQIPRPSFNLAPSPWTDDSKPASMLRRAPTLLPIANNYQPFKESEPDLGRDGLSTPVPPFSVDTDLVTKRAKSHEQTYVDSVAGHILCQNLPEFESLYYPDKEEADRLLQKEITRLQAGASQPVSEPFIWTSNQDGSPSQPAISQSTLLEAVTHLWCNMAVMMFNNSLIFLEHTRFCSENADVEALYQQALFSLRHARAVMLSNFVHASQYVATERMQPLQPDTIEANTYDGLVDYISASVYRLFVHSASGQTWTHSTMAVLARISRKLKDLKTNAARCAEECMDATEDLHADLKDENLEAHKRYLFCRKESEPIDVLDDSFFIKGYFVDEFQYRMTICGIITRTLNSIKENLSETGNVPLRANCEFSTLIEAASGMSVLVIDSERNGNMRTTTRQSALAFSFNACRLLLPLAEHIGSENNKIQDVQGSAGIRWWWQKQHPKRPLEHVGGQGFAHFGSLSHSLSMIIHLVFTTSGVSNTMTNLSDYILSLPGQENDVVLFEPPEGCRLAFTLSRSIARHEAWQEHAQVISLPAYSLRQRPAESPNERSRTPGMALRDRYQATQGALYDWVFDNEAIVIKCRMVAAIIIVPALLVAGGGVALLLAPFQKPKGVDPSNLMIFMWTISISYLLMAKAFFVPDWPWHDFLRAEVSCGSVSEVGRITGIDRQLILVHVLANEGKVSLRYKGPYAMLFSSLGMERTNSNRDGFAIDEPITLDAVYASGYLVLKVITHLGPRLVFVDSRDGTSHSIANGKTRRTYLVAEEFSKTCGDERRSQQRPMQLDKQELFWQHHTVLGLYVDKSATFV